MLPSPLNDTHAMISCRAAEQNGYLLNVHVPASLNRKRWDVKSWTPATVIERVCADECNFCRQKLHKEIEMITFDLHANCFLLLCVCAFWWNTFFFLKWVSYSLSPVFIWGWFKYDVIERLYMNTSNLFSYVYIAVSKSHVSFLLIANFCMFGIFLLSRCNMLSLVVHHTHSCH